jgi:hypothetical protein
MHTELDEFREDGDIYIKIKSLEKREHAVGI